MSLHSIYQRLYAAYGPQHWWPAESAFEVMVGAILVQNTAWSNVEKAIANLKANQCLTDEAILAAPQHELARWLKPSGCFNIKQRRLLAYCTWYRQRGGYAALSAWPTDRLRTELLALNGIGPETADAILLYAFQRPVFVIDAYTRRVFARLGFINGAEPYEALRTHFEASLNTDAQIYNEYHALIVQHGKDVCRKSPACETCVLHGSCKAAIAHAHAMSC
jgi:endonuclease-3 related protein